MQVPKRKAEKFTNIPVDPHITQDKFDELTKSLAHLKKVVRPQAAKEAQIYAQNGDFSENAEYQIAKGRLRGINQRILDIEELLRKAVIIQYASGASTVQLGSQVTVSINGKEKTFRLLGSSESNPSKGIISHNSPIGEALMDKKVGDVAMVKVGDREIEYRVVLIT